MRFTLVVLGHEILSFGTPPEPGPVLTTADEYEANWRRWKANNGTTDGQFGFADHQMTPIEEGEDRWEPRS